MTDEQSITGGFLESHGSHEGEHDVNLDDLFHHTWCVFYALVCLVHVYASAIPSIMRSGRDARDVA
jgi:hypothetical protein